MPLDIVKLNADKIRELPRDKTVFFFAVGPIEDHGPHLPVGLDLAEAQTLCRMAAKRLESEMSGWFGVIMPTVPLGVDSNTKSLRITVRAHVLRDWLVDACRSLERSGFRHFACFSGHLGPRQLTAIEEAGKIISKHSLASRFGARPRSTLVSACSPLVVPADVRRAPAWPDPLEHGGTRDTSVALVLGADQVNSIYASLPALNRPDSAWERAWMRLRDRITGYWGEPAQATATDGEKTLAGELDLVFPKMRAVWDGSNPNMLFRSWYSLVPSNGSFFKAWILALAFVILMTVWVYWNVTAMMTVT